MLFNILNVNEKEKKRKNLTSLNINLALGVIIASTSVTCAVRLSDIMSSTDFSFQKPGFLEFI
jgi:hypothetical protein